MSNEEMYKGRSISVIVEEGEGLIAEMDEWGINPWSLDDEDRRAYNLYMDLIALGKVEKDV